MNAVDVDSNIEESTAVLSGPQADWFKDVASFVEAVLKRLNIDGWELSVLFCADPFIATLNKQYRGIDGSTDVLSFSQEDEHIAGDIVISLDTLRSNAREFKVPVDEELKRLLVHGILHLAGLGHTDTLDGSPQQEMLILQEQVLTELQDYTIIKG
jgi:probable rRNA maturation factor